jgi:signal transduction histidine kinase
MCAPRLSEDWLACVHPEDRERVRSGMNSAIAGNASFRLEYRLTVPGESLRWISSEGNVVRDSQGQPVRMIGSTVDVTESRLREQELATSKNETQNLLWALEQTHGQLLQSDKMASIGALAAGVAHEINNPIGFISSNLNALDRYVQEISRVLAAHGELLELCLKEPSTVVADKARAVQQICQEADLSYLLGDLGDLIAESSEGAQRVRQIVSDLRDFSHVDSPDITDEDINRLFEKTINVACNELRYKAEVVRQFGEIPSIPCYGGKLGQVFLNLLVNAAHAIEDRGTITIRTGLGDGVIRIEIQDTGCGIPPENLTRLYDPFFTTKEVGKGTGMGLHLAYKIIEAHRGRISVDSTVGVGTTFRIELPLDGPRIPDGPQDKTQTGAAT